MPLLGAQTLEQALGRELGARVTAIVARYPPAPGDLVELAPDKQSVTWRDAKGQGHLIEFEFFPIANGACGHDHDGIVIEDDGEDDDTGWENETDDGERVA